MDTTETGPDDGGDRLPVRGEGLSERLDHLVAAVEGLVREVEGLGTRLERLERSRGRKSRSETARGRPRRGPSESVEVVIRPVPELAMAAVAERALRKADSVEAVTREELSESGERFARYRVEMKPGSDLVEEVGQTLPVAFSARQEEPGKVMLDLRW